MIFEYIIECLYLFLDEKKEIEVYEQFKWKRNLFKFWSKEEKIFCSLGDRQFYLGVIWVVQKEIVLCLEGGKI